MAETLGSLIDKLSIKSIRQFYLNRMLTSKKLTKQARAKLKVLAKQKEALLREVEGFISLAIKGDLLLKDEKLKLYNKPQMVGKIGTISRLSQAIDALAQKNMQLWGLEDEARREDMPLTYIGKVKRKIDFANQQRNDLIDKIDAILEKKIRASKPKRRAH
ncbi:DUF4254 domain-containing protein [Candidatus Omnitrophota bacterium]